MALPLICLFFSDNGNLEMTDILDSRPTEATKNANANLQRAAASIAQATAPLDSSQPCPTNDLIELELGSEPSASNLPIEDTEASFKMAAWAGVPVQLNALYQPFVTSIVAESRDELKALRDIAFVQDELHRTQNKVATYLRRQVFLQGEVSATEINQEDKTQSQKSKLLRSQFCISLQFLPKY